MKWTKEKFFETRNYVRTLKIKSRKKYFEHVIIHNNLPKRPDSLEWWISWSDWLGTNNRFYGNNSFLTYDESKQIVSKLNIKTKKEWEIFCKQNKISNIPRCPDKTYKEWISWSDWFGIKSRTDKNYETFESFIKILNDLNIHSKNKYISLYKKYNLPINPLSFYKIDSLKDILPKKEIKKNKLDYSIAKEIVNKMNLKSQKEWFNVCKSNQIPDNIPKTPNKYYEDEWISWNDWLGHNNTTHKNYLTYSKAKEFLSTLGLTSLQEYYDYIILNKIDFLPLQPITYYGINYISSDDFLNYDKRISYGEKKIIEYLNIKSIEYSHQHIFSDCKNINNLRFDFFISTLNMCIEFDGRQHYESIKFFGGDEGFYKRKLNDSIKNKYCIDNKIKMLRITFEDINIIDKILDKNLSF
jgi:hypothetical protein